MISVLLNLCQRVARTRLVLMAVPVWVAVAGFAAPTNAQRTWVVDNTMSAGADFPDLISAYATAARGDRIQIRLGDGSGYRSPALFDKAMTIVGIGSTKPVITVGTNVYTRCSQNEVMVFDNVVMRPTNQLGLAIQIQRNNGLVVFSRVTAQGYMYSSTPLIAGMSRVVMIDSTILHGALSIYAEYTRLWLLNCQTQTLSAGDRNLNGAITVNQGSFLRVVGGRHIGGDGLGDCYPLSPGYLGEPAIHAPRGPAVVSGPATLIGGLTSTFNPVCSWGGGTGRGGAISSGCLPGENGTAIDPMVVMQSGGPSPGCRLNQIREMPAVIPRPATRGQAQRIDAYGPQQSIVAVFASFLTPYEPIVLPVGDVWLDPALTVHIGSGGVDAQRHVAFTTTIPSWLAIGDVLVYQAVSLSPSSVFEISAPGIAVVH